MKEWYLQLSQVSAAASIPAKEIADSAHLPLLSVLLLGFVGGMSPCQITTNFSSSAYVSRGLSHRRIWREAVAYTLTKLLVYMSIGGAVIVLGLKLMSVTGEGMEGGDDKEKGSFYNSRSRTLVCVLWKNASKKLTIALLRRVARVM